MNLAATKKVLKLFVPPGSAGDLGRDGRTQSLGSGWKEPGIALGVPRSWQVTAGSGEPCDFPAPNWRKPGCPKTGRARALGCQRAGAEPRPGTENRARLLLKRRKRKKERTAATKSPIPDRRCSLETDVMQTSSLQKLITWKGQNSQS